MTLSAHVTDFLEYLELEQKASQLTIRNYDDYLKRFLEFAGDIEPNNIDLQLIRRYKLFLSRKPLKKVTQNYFLIAIRAYLRYLATVDVKTLSPEQVELRDQDPRPLKILDDTQLNQILTRPDISKKDGIRDRAILETLFSTGLRISEFTALNREDINSLPDTALDWINKYLSVRKDSFRPLFIRFQGRVDTAASGEAMRLTPRSIERIVEKFVLEAGISVKATPHTLRHFYYMHVTNQHSSK